MKLLCISVALATGSNIILHILGQHCHFQCLLQTLCPTCCPKKKFFLYGLCTGRTSVYCTTILVLSLREMRILLQSIPICFCQNYHITTSYESLAWLYFLLFYFILFYFIYFWEGETECEQGRSRERGRHRVRSRLQVLSCQHRARGGAQTHKSRDHDLSRSRRSNWQSHPGAPT